MPRLAHAGRCRIVRQRAPQAAPPQTVNHLAAEKALGATVTTILIGESLPIQGDLTISSVLVLPFAMPFGNYPLRPRSVMHNQW